MRCTNKQRRKLRYCYSIVGQSAGIAVMSSYNFGGKKVYRFKRQVGSGDGGEDEEGGLAGIGRVRTFFPET